MLKDARNNYKDIYKNMTEQEFEKAIYKEVTADLVGEYIFSDVDFVRNLSIKNPNVFQKVFDEIKYLLKQVKAGTDTEKKLLKAKKIFEDVYRDSKTTKNENNMENNVKKEYTQYSLFEFYDTPNLECRQTLNTLPSEIRQK